MTSNANAREPRTRTAELSVAELVSQLSEQVSRLVHDELRLAQLEIQRKATRVGVGAGLFGFAGLTAFFGAATLVACAVLALALVVDAWLAALIVAVALLLVAGIATLVGRRQIQHGTPPVPTEAMESIRLDVETVKEHLRR